MKTFLIPKRLGAFFLCFALLVGMLPAGALAADTDPPADPPAGVCDTPCTADHIDNSCPVCAVAPAQCGAAGLCEHHPAHTAKCGYTEGSTGTPCTRSCLKNVNMPNQRGFCPLDGAIFP